MRTYLLCDVCSCRHIGVPIAKVHIKEERSSLFLDELSEEAFPFVAKCNRIVRDARRYGGRSNGMVIPSRYTSIFCRKRVSLSRWKSVQSRSREEKMHILIIRSSPPAST